MIEPTLSARDLFIGFYAALVVLGSLYLFSAGLLLAEYYRKREKRKREGKL
jgi:hypothetical protein